MTAVDEEGNVKDQNFEHTPSASQRGGIGGTGGAGEGAGSVEDEATQEDKQEWLVNRDDKHEEGLPREEGGGQRNEGVGTMEPNGI